MQIHPTRLTKTSGHALLIVLGITCVVMIGLAGSMMLVNGQYRSTLRSQDWNGAIPVTEAGIEEAMAHLNLNCFVSGINPTVFQPESQGWVKEGASNVLRKERIFSDKSYYDVTIDLTDTNSPIVFSRGYTVKPYAAAASPLMMATIGAENVNTAQYLNRNIRVTTRQQPLFRHALAADGTIDLSGNNVETDSFNSRTNSMSTNGRYDKTKRSARGDVASNTNLTGAVSVGNANILGDVSVGPGGSITIGANGVIGDRNWVETGGTGVQEGHTNSDMNVYFPEVKEPFSNGKAPEPPVSLLSIVGYTTNEVVLGTCSCGSYATIPCCQPPGTGGTVLQVTESKTTITQPALFTYSGMVTTNWTSGSSVSYPSGTVRNVSTNTVTITTEPFQLPLLGSYLGLLTTNLVFKKNQKDKPFEGQYVPGTLTKSNNRWNYSVHTYTYQRITGYSYEVIGSYSYLQITGYRRVIQSVVTNYENITYNYVFDSGRYKVGSLSGNILIRGHAEIYCTGNIQISGQDRITILKNASVKLHVAGSTTSIAGKGIINEGGYASDFSYYGLPSNKNISIQGNGEFSGTIYAPQAHLSLGGGGNNTQDFVGAAIVGSARLNGHFRFHYDESLEWIGPARGYMITSWREE